MSTITSNDVNSSHIWCNGEESCEKATFYSHISQGNQEFDISCSNSLKSCDLTTLECLTPSYDDVFGEEITYRGCQLHIEGVESTQTFVVYSYFGYDFLDTKCKDDDILVEIDGSSDTFQTVKGKIETLQGTQPFSCDHVSVKCGDEWAWTCQMTPSIKNISNYSSLLPFPNSVKNISLTQLIRWECVGDEKCSKFLFPFSCFSHLADSFLSTQVILPYSLPQPSRHLLLLYPLPLHHRTIPVPPQPLPLLCPLLLPLRLSHNLPRIPIPHITSTTVGLTAASSIAAIPPTAELYA